jgi:hypothetical protein
MDSLMPVFPDFLGAQTSWAPPLELPGIPKLLRRRVCEADPSDSPLLGASLLRLLKEKLEQ